MSAARARSSDWAWRSVSPSVKLLSLSRGKKKQSQKHSWSSDSQRQPLQLPNGPPCSNLCQGDRYHSVLLFHKESTRRTPARGCNNAVVLATCMLVKYIDKGNVREKRRCYAWLFMRHLCGEVKAASARRTWSHQSIVVEEPCMQKCLCSASFPHFIQPRLLWSGNVPTHI